ncbi:MAG: DNA primase [Candidatus Dadabacteria bacterium]|nr:DNA primase [Candidatus Dadabacteria bacterium]
MATVSAQELKSRVSIAEIINGYVPLKKAGASYKGLCPFHDDKNPSLHVDDDKGMFYCFSCKAGGDVFAFLQRINGGTFPEALREVAEKAGVSVEAFSSSENKGAEEILNMNRAVCGFFRRSLSSGSAESGAASSYLRGRGVTSEMEENFSIGYAPSAPSALPDFIGKQGFSMKRAAEAGLVASNERGYYGKFRGRLMFPIFSPDGKVIGFGGRILNPEASPAKYLNSAESAVYKKRRSLYGLHKTRQEIRKSGVCVLVEGYMDLLSVYEAGVKNTAASLGTSLTREQVNIIRRYADDVVILYDGDRAGIDASFTAGEVFMSHGIVPRIARVPGGLDPDRFAREKGSAALKALIEAAPPLTGVLMDDISAALSEKKIQPAAAARRLMAVVPALGNSPETGPYVTEVSRRFGFRENDLYSTVKSMTARSRPSVTAASKEESPVQKVSAAEMMLLRISLKFPRTAEFLSGEEVSKLIQDGEVKTVISSMSASGVAASSGADGALLSHAHFTLDEIDYMDESNVRAEIEKCLVRLKLDAIGRELETIREELRVSESGGGADGTDLMQRYKELLDEKQRINSEELQ